MHTQKRGVVIQIVLYSVFSFMGIDYIVREFVNPELVLVRVIELSGIFLILGLGVLWFLLTKKEAFIIMDRKWVKILYACLSIIFVALLTTIFTGSFVPAVEKILNIIAGSLMVAASAVGIYVSLKAYFSKNAGND